MTPEERLAQIAKQQQQQYSPEVLEAIEPKARSIDIARSIGQGASFGFGDEIEAAIAGLIPGGEGYSERVERVRAELKAFQQANPGTAITTEMIGAIVPAALTFGSTSALSGATTTARLGNLARVGAAEGAIAGVGYGNVSNVQQGIASAATGGVTGMLVSPALGIAGDGVVQIMRSIGGNSAASKVQAELIRLAESTGKTVDEIVEDIASGRLMAENQTLQAAVKVYTQRAGGGAGAKAREKISDRKEQTQKRAELELRKGLSPQSPRLTDNLEAGFLRSDEELRLLERQDYIEAFPKGQIVGQELELLVIDAANRVPEVAKDLNKIARAEGLPPLFTKNKDTGFLEPARPIDMMGVEMTRRVLRDRADKLFRDGKGTVAAPIANLRNELQDAFYKTYDGSDGQASVESVVNAAFVRRQKSEAFKEGQKALGAGIEQVELLVNNLTPETTPAFRAGFMSALRNKISAQANPMEVIAGDSRLGPKVRAVFPNENIEELMQTLQTAQGAEALDKFMRGGSPTQPLQEASSQIGTGPVSVVGRLAVGDATGAVAAGMGAVQRMLTEATPNLTPEQYTQVLNVMMSESPSVVRNALTDKTRMQQFNALAVATAERLGFYTRQQATTRSGQFTGGIIGNLEELQ